MKIFYDPATEPTPELIAGDPPVDQTSLVTQLQNQITQLTADLATRTQERDQRQSAINAMKVAAQQEGAADAAKVDGQAILDAAGNF